MTSGWKKETNVAVSESPTALTFKALRDGKPICVDDVVIYSADDQLNPLWSIGPPIGAKCRSEFRYGEAPAGFVASAAPAKLIVGQS